MKNRMNKNTAFGLLGLGIAGVVLGAVTVAKGAPRVQKPFVIGGIAYPSQASFIASGNRCGTENPSAKEMAAIQARLNATSGEIRIMGGKGRTGVINISVYVHIIRDDSGVGDVTNTQINNQIAFLNKSFGGTEKLTNGTAPIKPAKTIYQFVLKGVTRTNNSAWYGLTPGYPAPSTEENAMKTALRVGGEETLNIYSLNLGGGLLGIARFPWDHAAYPKVDGIMLLKDTFPGGTAAPYNLGDTATHEIGHWLGLWHTFQGGCTTANDNVSDTPAESGPFYGVPTAIRNSCTGVQFPGNDPTENYMDYTDDAYMYRFSTGQAQRVDSIGLTYRGL